MVPEFLPTTDEGLLVHLMEECAEVTKVCAKILRFGPETENYDNRSKLREEIKDLRAAIFRVESRLL